MTVVSICKCNSQAVKLCWIRGSHCRADEVSSLLACHAVSLGMQFPAFRMIEGPSFSGSNSKTFLGLLDPENDTSKRRKTTRLSILHHILEDANLSFLFLFSFHCRRIFSSPGTELTL